MKTQKLYTLGKQLIKCKSKKLADKIRKKIIQNSCIFREFDDRIVINNWYIDKQKGD